MEAMLKTGISLPFELEYRHRDGRRIPVLIGSAITALQPNLEWIASFWILPA